MDAHSLNWRGLIEDKHQDKAECILEKMLTIILEIIMRLHKRMVSGYKRWAV